MSESLPVKIGSDAPATAAPKNQEVLGGPRPQMTDAEIMAKMGLKDESIEDAEAKFLGKSVQETDPSKSSEHSEKEEHQPESEPEAGVETTEDGDDLDAAWKALERDGWSKADLKKLSRDRIIELGAKRSKVQADFDKAYADLKSLKAKNQAANPADGTDSAPSTEDLLAGFAEFEKTFMPEDAKVLRGVIEPLAKKLMALENVARHYVEQSGAREAARIRDGYTKLYPELKNDIAWDAVRAAAQSVDAEDPEVALRQAVSQVYGDRSEKKGAGPIKNVATIPGRNAPPKPMSKDEREFLAFTQILRGDKDKARQIWNSGTN